MPIRVHARADAKPMGIRMRPPPARSTLNALSRERGFGVVDLMIGITILLAGILSVSGSIDTFRSLATNSATRESGTHVAEQELERLRSIGWKDLLMDAAPSHDTNPRHPWYWIEGEDPNVTYRPSADADVQALAVAGTNDTAGVSHLPTAWQADGYHGKVYRFVTWGDDPECLDPDGDGDSDDLCPGTEDYKRVTVAVTFESRDAPREPITASTIVINPSAKPVGGAGDGSINPLTSPQSNPPGSSIAGASSKTWFAYDTPASSSTRVEPSGDHATHATSTTPDMLGQEAPPNPLEPPNVPPLYDYSTDVTTTGPGGAVIRRSSSGCGGGDDTRAHLWTSPAFSVATTVTGNGAASLSTGTAAGTAAGAAVCVRVYDLELSSGTITSKTLLGSARYELTSWPGTPQRVSFVYRFLAAGATHQLRAGRRLGFELTVDAASADDVRVVYDHPDHPSYFQAETAPAA